MRILVVRHAEAEDLGHGVPGKDSARRLTDAGREQIAQMAKALGRLQLTPQLVLTSPLVRAKQTADVLCEVLGVGLAAQESPSLAPGGRWGDVTGAIDRALKKERIESRAKYGPLVAVVGHQPGLGEMIAAAVGARGGLELQKGAVVGLRWPGAGYDGEAEIFVALTGKLAARI